MEASEGFGFSVFLREMQRKRGELVPIGEAFGGLDGPVKALRETSP